MKVYKYKVTTSGHIYGLPDELKGKEVYIIDEDYKLSLEQMILSNLVFNKKYKEDIERIESLLKSNIAELRSNLKLLDLKIGDLETKLEKQKLVDV